MKHATLLLLLVCVSLTFAHVVPEGPTARSFVVSGSQFLKDGQPFRIISGSVHYFRTIPEQWKDRLTMAKQLGLNAVQFYIPWNLHEPEKDQYTFEGVADVVEFIQLAQSLDLLVVLRPGPYACGEWEFGGFPYWLLRDYPEIALRSADPHFLDRVDRWFSVLFPRLAPLVYSKGGPIIMMQVENEYGSYGNDKVYLGHLRGLMGKYVGDDAVVFHSTDGPSPQMLAGSYIGPEVYQTVDFGPGDNATANFEQQMHLQGPAPAMNSEYYTGWLTHWGDAHAANVSASMVSQSLLSLMSTMNASVNLYMFHGGTNYGFMNGANANGPSDYEITITSYDYNSPLTEAGDPNDKYAAIRDVISRFSPVSGPVPKPQPKGSYGTVPLTQSYDMYSCMQGLASSQVTSPGMHRLVMILSLLHSFFHSHPHL
eukprot:TRINITY_DN1880_c0_g1_i3.p1 TRINITY_DN1880_c0_g1~~TRINITY_DN1880_c0_g1_i3.p1  ORF type:complete len:426 (+),score=76.44 TRINITY_DN1880_c0_g1_i3:49-1326(+)